MNVITLINLLCSDYAGPSHNGNGSNNDDAIGEGDGLGLSASNSFVEADDDESVGSVFEFIAHPDGMMIARHMWRTFTMTLLMIVSVLLLFLLLTLISATKVNPVMMARLVIVVAETVWATMRTCL